VQISGGSRFINAFGLFIDRLIFKGSPMSNTIGPVLCRWGYAGMSGRAEVGSYGYPAGCTWDEFPTSTRPTPAQPSAAHGSLARTGWGHNYRWSYFDNLFQTLLLNTGFASASNHSYQPNISSTPALSGGASNNGSWMTNSPWVLAAAAAAAATATAGGVYCLYNRCVPTPGEVERRGPAEPLMSPPDVRLEMFPSPQAAPSPNTRGPGARRHSL
jgi:hypothetical protein